MYQDDDGYMWFGTYDGLNLYNGKNVFVYRFEPDNEFSLCSNIIHKVTQADEDNLWVSTFLGLNKFSLRERKVVESYTQCPEARLLASDSKGNTCVIHKKNYISYYTTESKTFRDIHVPGVSVENVLDIFVTKNDQLYLIMSDGRLRNIQITGSINDPKLSSTDNEVHENNIIVTFYEDDKLYFIDSANQLFLYDIKNARKDRLADISDLVSKYGDILRIASSKQDMFILSKNGDLVKLHIEAGERKAELINSGIGVFCLLKDKKQDILWIGTDGQGVQMYYQKEEMFRNITFDNLTLGIQKPIRAIYTDEFDNLWIGTKGDGIIRINNYNHADYQIASSIQHNHFSMHNGLSNGSVFSFLRSLHRNILWIGTNGPGISYYSYQDNTVRSLTGTIASQIGKVHSICEVDESTLWLATAGNGLMEVSIKEDNNQLSITSVNVFLLKKGDRVCNEFHSMSYDGKSTLFIGSRGGYGVARFDINTKEYEFIQMNKSDNSAIGDVLSVLHSKDSIFYIGASSGMSRIHFFKNGAPTIRQFDRRNGIANDMIHGILEDKDGCIWLSTNKGLTKYNPHNDFFHNYSYPDLRVTEFSDDAYWRDSNGRLFFGGINGLVWVDAEDGNLKNYYKPNLLFFDLEISGESHTLYNYMNKDEVVELASNVSSFTISFVALDYINGDNYEYSYILEDYNTSWTELQKANAVTFTNLPHGKYTLKVKYKNDVFGSEDRYFSLNIIKLPPWYLTVWAILGYIVMFLTLCSYIIYIAKRKISKRQRVIARRMREEQKEKLLEAKLNFFTNVTHEFCTPLTVINGVTEFIEKTDHANEELKKYTYILRDNVNDLNNLIQEILDFRKIEETKLELKIIKQVSIHELIYHQMESFVPMAKQSNINFDISVPENLYWNTDVVCFKRVLANLVSNAFKYVNEGGNVKVTANCINDFLTLTVYNTGIGIDRSMIPHIFDRYRILENIENNSYSKHSSRNGVGLSICQDLVKSLHGNITVNSEINKYAEFVVTFPVLEATEENELENEKLKESFPKDILSRTGSKQTILVVDDNKDIVWMISNILKSNYNVHGVHSAEEGLKFIEEQTPSLIITDIMMPDMNGLDFISKLKANKFTKHIPLVIVSAKISDKEQAQGLDMGADAYLTKPFSAVVLSSIVSRLLSTKVELKDYYNSPESAYEYSDGQLIHQEDKDFMDSIISIIDSNLEEENLRPELLATKLGMSTRSLYRKFKKITSLSPNDFIKDYRFITAAKLLVSTNLTIQEIIYKIGINNKSYFYREFFKKYNMTPKEYRMRK